MQLKHDRPYQVDLRVLWVFDHCVVLPTKHIMRWCSRFEMHNVGAIQLFVSQVCVHLAAHQSQIVMMVVGVFDIMM